MGEKPGKVQALVVEFSADCTAADCTAIRAKSGEGGYSEAVESWRKGVYTSYTPILLYSYTLVGNMPPMSLKYIIRSRSARW